MGAKTPAAARTSTLSFNAQQLLDAVVGAAAGDGRVPDGIADFAKERGDNRLVVVAAAPKAGSTFLVNTLIQVTGLRGFRLCSAYSTNENDLYLPALCLMNRHGCVSQLHMKGTFHNAALMRSFGITPVILGGDHSITWPAATAVADHHGWGNVGVVHFDAHADTADILEGNLASHGTPMRRLIESGAVQGRHFV